MPKRKMWDNYKGSRLVDIREDALAITVLVGVKLAITITITLWLMPNNRPQHFRNRELSTLTSLIAKWTVVIYTQRLLIVTNRCLRLNSNLTNINRDSHTNVNSSLTEQCHLNYWNSVEKSHKLLLMAIRASKMQINNQWSKEEIVMNYGAARNSTSQMRIESLKIIIHNIKLSIKQNLQVHPPLYCPPNKAMSRRSLSILANPMARKRLIKLMKVIMLIIKTKIRWFRVIITSRWAEKVKLIWTHTKATLRESPHLTWNLMKALKVLVLSTAITKKTSQALLTLSTSRFWLKKTLRRITLESF